MYSYEFTSIDKPEFSFVLPILTIKLNNKNKNISVLVNEKLVINEVLQRTTAQKYKDLKWFNPL